MPRALCALVLYVLRALVPPAPRSLMLHVTHSLSALMPYLPLALHALVPHAPLALGAFMPHVPCALCALVLSCLTDLVPHVLSWCSIAETSTPYTCRARWSETWLLQKLRHVRNYEKLYGSVAIALNTHWDVYVNCLNTRAISSFKFRDTFQHNI